LNKADPPFFSDHPDELLLPYVEHGLSPEEYASVREHLDGCPQCSDQLEDLRRVVSVLRTEKGVFCPEPWSLYEFAVKGADPGQTLSKHLETCGACREEVQVLRASLERPERLGDDVWAQIQERLPRTASTVRPLESSEQEPESFLQRFFTRFTVPKLAAAAAAAMILALVMMQPADVIQPMVAVSSITWENSPKPKSPDSPGRKRTALLILLKDFEKPPPQKVIDNLYEALEPGVDINERYQLLTPADVKNFAKKLRFSEEYRKGSLDTLRQWLEVSAVVLVTIMPSGDKFSIRGEMRDTATDRVIAGNKVEGVSSADLSSKTREIVQALMLR